MTQAKIKAGIVGAAGYTGGELIRLLLQHPAVQLTSINSQSNAGKLLYEVHRDLLGETDLQFSRQDDFSVEPPDVLFLCLGHGASKAFLESHQVPDHTRIIDLSQDFRLEPGNVREGRDFVYGLPELNKDSIKKANAIANPGCFATAIQLGLLPLAKAGLLGDVYTTGITGSTGAGQGLSETAHFSWRSNNISAYKTLTHQHLQEITQSVNQLQQAAPLDNNDNGIWFVPWRGDFARGIFVSSTLSCTLPLAEVKDLFAAFYADSAFTHISPSMIDLKQVVNTNKCCIYIEQAGNKMVVHSAIDNLLKGACGQAVQNMNLMFGLDEQLGLKLKATGF